MGRPFAAVLRLTPEYKIEFDFGQDKRDGDGALVEMDFTGQEAVGKCPKCQNRGFRDCDELYLRKGHGREPHVRVSCRKSDFANSRWSGSRYKNCSRPARPICCRDLFRKKAGHLRPFLVAKDGGIGFEFEPRAAKSKKAGKGEPKEPAPKSTSPVRISWQMSQVRQPGIRHGGGVPLRKVASGKTPLQIKISKTILEQQSSGHKRPSSSPKQDRFSSINSYPKPAGLSRRI